MRCRLAQRMLTQLLDDRLLPRERRRLQAHLDGCRECREMRDLLAAAHGALANQPAAEPPPGLAERAVLSALEADPLSEADRGRAAGGASAAPEALWGWARWPALATATAAMVLAVSLTLFASQPHMSGEASAEESLVLLSLEGDGERSPDVEEIFDPMVQASSVLGQEVK